MYTYVFNKHFYIWPGTWKGSKYYFGKNLCENIYVLRVLYIVGVKGRKETFVCIRGSVLAFWPNAVEIWCMDLPFMVKMLNVHTFSTSIDQLILVKFFFFLLCLVAWPSTICLKKCGDIWVIKFFIIIFIEVYFSFYDVLPLFGDSLWMLDPTRPEKPLWKMTSMILSAQTLLNFECIKEILVVTTIVNGYMDMFQLSS